MEMVILLLLSAVAQLATPVPTALASGNARLSRNQIIDAINNYTTTFTNDFFVEDVQDLVTAGCKNGFFCKVHSILVAHKKVGETKKDEMTLERLLKAYINSSSIDCKEELKSVKSSTVTRPITDLLENIRKCSQKTNLVRTD